MSHYSRILYIFLKCYIGIWIYYFINLFYKKDVCVHQCVCARRSLNGCWAEWVSQWSLSDKRHVELQTFEKHQEPFLLPLLSSMFQPIEITSEVMVDSRSDLSKLSNFTCDFQGSTETWRRRPAPSACWVKIIKRRLLCVKGMKVWLTGEIIRSVSQSVSPCQAQTTCSLSDLNWQRHNTSVYSPSRQSSNNSLSAEEELLRGASSKAFL